MKHLHTPLLFRCLSFALAVALPFGTVATASAQSNLADRIANYSQTIWQGLWAGANGDISTTTSSSTSTTGTSATQRPATTAPASGSNSAAATVTTGAAGGGTYAALGDSVAAGVGLPGAAPVPADYTRCGRTTQAYPYIVAQQQHKTLNHVACSGATAGDLYTKQRSGSPNLPSQLSVAYAAGKPDLLTITAGANDAQWTYFLRYCYTNDCAAGTIPFSASQGCIPDKITSISTTNLANCYLAVLQIKLVGAFWAIQHYSGVNPPTTVITGYYNPLSAACSTKFPNITPAEVAWMQSEVNALNGTIRQVAAQYPFVRFAPVDFTGHDVCSSDPWVQGLSSPQPFHPTTRGQQEIAAAVLGQL